MAKSLMIQGTMSNAGKSLLTAGLLRIMKQDGYRVAPFKSQNMALNSFITKDGLEMGRAQVVQAEAAGIEPSVEMNPILLKPTTDVGSQVIVKGVPMGHMPAREYFAIKKNLIPQILDSYNSLSQKYDIIIIEGAGSPAEINLKADDIVNMGLARLTKSPVLLVGDIDRGGVFAQLYGTVMLLEEEEKNRIRGLIINKFRGDKTILDPGIRMIEDLCHIPVVGVAPFVHVNIEDEDSLGVHLADTVPSLVDIAVIRLPKISNFTDFQVFESIPQAGIRYVSDPHKLGNPDLILLPGTKSTIDDLLWMRSSGMEAMVLKQAAAGTPIIGICGGYQMLGKEILDPLHTENAQMDAVKGMGLLPVTTVFHEEKTRTRVEGNFSKLSGALQELSGQPISGYEIHMGTTTTIAGDLAESDTVRPILQLREFQKDSKTAKTDGCNLKNVYGTYVHGIFDGEQTAYQLVKLLMERKGISSSEMTVFDYRSYKEAQYDKLADALREHLDMETIYRTIFEWEE